MKSIIWRSRATAWFGLIIALVPFLGLPDSFKNIIFVIFGLLIALFGFAKSHYASGYEKEYKQALEEVIVSTEEKETLSNGPVLDEEE